MSVPGPGSLGSPTLTRLAMVMCATIALCGENARAGSIAFGNLHVDLDQSAHFTYNSVTRVLATPAPIDVTVNFGNIQNGAGTYAARLNLYAVAEGPAEQYSAGRLNFICQDFTSLSLTLTDTNSNSAFHNLLTITNTTSAASAHLLGRQGAQQWQFFGDLGNNDAFSFSTDLQLVDYGYVSSFSLTMSAMEGVRARPPAQILSDFNAIARTGSMDYMTPAVPLPPAVWAAGAMLSAMVIGRSFRRP